MPSPPPSPKYTHTHDTYFRMSLKQKRKTIAKVHYSSISHQDTPGFEPQLLRQRTKSTIQLHPGVHLVESLTISMSDSTTLSVSVERSWVKVALAAVRTLHCPFCEKDSTITCSDNLTSYRGEQVVQRVVKESARNLFY